MDRAQVAHWRRCWQSGKLCFAVALGEANQVCFLHLVAKQKGDVRIRMRRQGRSCLRGVHHHRQRSKPESVCVVALEHLKNGSGQVGATAHRLHENNLRMMFRKAAGGFQ